MRIRIPRGLSRLLSSRKLSYEDCAGLVIGLGNPGRSYAGTRHNAGFMALDRLARDEKLSFLAGRGDFHAAKWRCGGSSILLAKPTTYMNLSGRAGAQLAELTGLAPESCLVVVDDIELPLGKLRLRGKGSSGGHNGLASLIEHWGTERYPRLRLGIGRPADVTTEHVLGVFGEEDLDTVDRMLDAAARTIQVFFERGLDRAMGECNANQPG